MKTKLFLSLSLLTMAFTTINAIDQTTVKASEQAWLKQCGSTFVNFKVNNQKLLTSLSTVLPEAKVAGVVCAGLGVATLAYKLNHDNKTRLAEALAKQNEKTRLANRSYIEMFKDSASTFGTKVSGLAQSAKANTWDTNAGFKHSGKVATIAGVAAVVGLSYLAKQKLFGKAVVKTTVAPEVTVVNNKRNRIS